MPIVPQLWWVMYVMNSPSKFSPIYQFLLDDDDEMLLDNDNQSLLD